MSIPTISLQVDPDSAAATVTLSGSLTIESSAELHRVLSESLNDSQKILLDMQHLKDIDMPSLQLICSACKTAVLQQRVLVCETPMPECVASLGRNLGASQGLPCNHNSNEPCIWFGGVK